MSPTRASLYIPGVLDGFIYRNSEGIWLVDPMVVHEANRRGAYNGKYIDLTDVYGDDPDSVESRVNEELSHLVNRMMFDDSARDSMP